MSLGQIQVTRYVGFRYQHKSEDSEREKAQRIEFEKATRETDKPSQCCHPSWRCNVDDGHMSRKICCEDHA